MRFEAADNVHGELGAPVEEVAGDAAEATALLYTNDASIDVEDQLRAQLHARGLTTDAETLADLARQIRSGHPVRLH